MASLKVKCTNQNIQWETEPSEMFAGNENIDSISFEFCPLWDGFLKTAVFYREADTAFHILLNENNSCIIPPEVTQENGLIYVGVIGVDGAKRRTTEPICFYLAEGIPTEGRPSDPTPDIYQQILSVCNDTYKIANAVREEAESGAFDGEKGEKGDKGDKGDPGATPVKGTDYWTEEDKAEIKGYVDEAILGGAW